MPGEPNIEKVRYFYLPRTVPYDEIKRQVFFSTKFKLFEGMSFDFTKGLNQEFSLSPSVFMTPTEVPFKVLSELILWTQRLLTDGRVYTRVRRAKTDSLTFKVNEQSSMFNFDNEGSDYKTQFQLGDGGLFGASYVQSVTPHITLGGEVFWDVQHQKSGVGFAAQFNTLKEVVTARIASPGIIAPCPVQVSEKVSLATEFIYNYMSKDVTATVGYDCILRQAPHFKIRVRCKFDSNGVAAAYLEERLNMGLNLIFSAEVDFRTTDCKYGFRLTFGE